MSRNDFSAFRRRRNIVNASLLILIGLFVLFSALPVGQEFWRGLVLKDNISGIPLQTEENPLNIFFLDVGKADCILIECEGEYALIDAGTVDRASDIKAMLNKLDIKELTYIFATHPDKDHIGSMYEIINDYDVGLFIEPIIPD